MMDKKIKRHKKIKKNNWILLSFLLLYSCSYSQYPKPLVTIEPDVLTGTITQTPTLLPGYWQMLGVYNEDQSIMTAGFLDEQYVATGGVLGQMAYSSNGAETWLITNSMADCRYGIEIVSPEVIWTCGGATHVRKSVDGGKTWQVLAGFGNPRTIRSACHSMSFLDENIGWLANSNLFGTTADGGVSWSISPLPETAHEIATIDTYMPSEGYLLDQDGVLFFTQDNGLHWRETSRLQMGPVKMSPSAYQLAAMRFSDAEHGLIVVSSENYGNAGTVIAFQTTDGGQSWVSEFVPVLAGPVYLSRKGGFLTVITDVDQLTLLKYKE
jgi:hypothetical protein